MDTICAGLLAHVDAGKTTLSEAMLYTAGALRKMGRVDHADAFLDTDAQERDRGITIFSKQARITWKGCAITLVDTPGHVDFSTETERTLPVLDCAVLLISGTDGVQAHTRTLWRLLERYAVPPGSVRSLEDGKDLRSGSYHRPGVYHFSGHSAVIYMRIRKAGGGGDFMRTQRARTVMSTLADKCREITWEEAEALVNNVMDNNTSTNINLEGMLEAARYAYSLKDCTIEELRLPPDGAVRPINFAAMAAQEVDWEACRAAMAYYLQNSFLVVDDEDE